MKHTYNTNFLLKVTFLSTLIVSSTLFLTQPSSAQEPASVLPPETYFDGEIIVKYQDDAAPEVIDQRVAEREARASTTIGILRNRQEDIALSIKGEQTPEEIKSQYDSIESSLRITQEIKVDALENTYVYALADDRQSFDAVVASYEDLPVEFVQPNYKYYLTATPNDSDYTKQWGMPLIKAPNGWDRVTGSKNVVVGIVDSGIDVNHPDLVQNVSKSVPIAQGCVNNGDSNGHGTHVAGVIGAMTNNSQGVAGLNWNVTINGYCVVNPSGIGSSLTIAQGINQAVTDGVDVINLSLGGPILAGTDQAILQAIQAADQANITVVAAAGNCGNLPPGQYPQNPECYWGGDADKYTPGAYQSTINVAAVGPQGEHPGYSNTGSTIDVSAPGGNPPSGSISCDPQGSDCVYSTWDRFKSCPSGTPSPYCSITGTSMAAPHVTGLVALILSVDNTLTPGNVKNIINSTAIDLGRGNKDPLFGYGLIQVDKALDRVVPTSLSPTPGTDCESRKMLGDYNCDGRISIADFEAWRQDFVQSLATLKEFEWFRAGFTQ